MILQAFEACRHGRERGISAVMAIWLMALLLAVPVGAGATEPAGRVIFSSGEVTAVNAEGFRRPLTRNDVVYPGETVHTAPRSMIDIRMRDDALISLDAESRFLVERYDRDAGAGNAVMRFLRGTLLTITGTIGKEGTDTYQMHTPVATIGVRGTQYALQLCDTDCARGDRPAGLYGYVDDGAISVTNEAASAVMSQGDYFHVGGPEVAPRRLVRPPKGILDGSSGDGHTGIGGGAVRVPGGTESLVDADDSLIEAEKELLDTSDSLLATTDRLVSGDGGLLDTGGTLLQTGGGLLREGGNLLEAGGDLLEQGGGGLLESGGDLLESGGGLVESDGGLLETGGDLLETTGGDVLETGSGILDTGGDLLGSGGGLLEDMGEELGGSGSLLESTDPGEEDLLEGIGGLITP